MASYSLDSIYGDNIPEESTYTGGGKWKKMVPPTQQLADGTLEITGFVSGVTIKEWKFDEEKNQLVVTYAATQGEGEDRGEATIRGWYTDPEFDGRITKQTDENKIKTMTNMSLNTVKGIVQKYVYTSAITNALHELHRLTGGNFTYEQYVDTLGKLVMGDQNKVKGDVSLKLVFKQANGVEPDYKIGQNRFIGTTGDEKYGPQWTKNGNEYDDITNFAIQEKTPDFDNSTDLSGGIDDVFSGGDNSQLL